ncbi:MAG: gliding motility protein GldM [Bacteroidales bacterium]|nr:gliding motility protein GldM [Bacteroidales bacterium]
MGATNCPETPRQKMIAMMYLVYTALLALNVSVEILNGFVTVGDAMDKSNTNIEKQLVDVYDQFDQAKKNDPEKVDALWNVAQQVRTYSDQLKNFLDSSRYEFLCQLQTEAVIDDHNGNKEKIILDNVENAKKALDMGGLEIIGKKDNTDVGTHFFYGSSDNPNGRAIEIKNKIIEYKENITKLFADNNIPDSVNFGMNVESEFYSSHAGRMVSWEEYNFDGAIAIANMVCLSRMKSELMNAEYDAVTKLMNMIGKEDFKFDQVAAICRPKSSYVVQGGKYEMKVNVGAYDSKRVFRAEINGQSFESGPDGSITYTVGAGGVGERKVKGTIYMVKDGKEEEYPFEESYYVAPPPVAVAELTKMNVVYSGIDNPISIAVPGVDNKDVSASISSGGATLVSQGGGNYIIKPSKLGKLTISVSAKIDGVTKNIGTKEIRVKRIPKPSLRMGNFKTGDQVSKAEVTANPVLRAAMEDFDFQIPAPKINSFVFNVQGSGALDINGTGNRLTADMLNRINNARRGQKIYITDVTVKTPDGQTHTLDCTLRLK